MKDVIIWLVLAALFTGAVIYTHAGLESLALAFIAWCGGMASLAALQRLRGTRGA